MNFMKRFLSKDPEHTDQSPDLTPKFSKEELITSLSLIRNDINEMVSLVIDGVDSNKLITAVSVYGGIVEIIFRHNGTISVKGAARWPKHREIYDVLTELLIYGYVFTAEDDELIKWAQANYNHEFAVNSALAAAFEEMGYHSTEDGQVLSHYVGFVYTNSDHSPEFIRAPKHIKKSATFFQLTVTKSKVPQVFNNIAEMLDDLTAIGNDLVKRHLVPIFKEVVNRTLTAYQKTILPSFPSNVNTVLPDGKMVVDIEECSGAQRINGRYIYLGEITVSEIEIEFAMGLAGCTETWMCRVFSDYQREHVLETAINMALKEAGFTKKRADVNTMDDYFRVKIK